MRIGFKPYRRRDGVPMIYINRGNGVSVGLSDRDWAPYGKGVTPGQRNAVEAALRAFDAHAKPFTGTVPADAVDCGGLFLLTTTDTANIGGQNVGSDGAYLIRNGRILRCGWYDEPA